MSRTAKNAADQPSPFDKPGLNVIQTTVKEEVETSFLEYAYSVIHSRALPDARDGLKPVHRRILYSMSDEGLRPDHAHVKSARVVGSCFLKGALVSTPSGQIPIEMLNVGDEVLDHEGNIVKVSVAYENPPREVVKLAFSTGHTLTVTPDQLFRVVEDDYTLTWCRADQLEGKRVLSLGPGRLPKEEIKATWADMTVEQQKAYAMGILVAEGSQVDRKREADGRVHFSMVDSEPVDEVIDWAVKEGLNYSRKLNKPEKDHWRDQHHVRIARHASLLEATKETSSRKTVPLEILSAKENWLPFIAGFLDGDGYVRKGSKAEIVLVSVSEMLIRQLRSMLVELGVMPSHWTRAKQKETEYDLLGLTVTGLSGIRLARMLLPFIRIGYKRDELNLMAELEDKTSYNRTDMLPGKEMFSEFSRKHLGAGWYRGTDGVAFRQNLDGDGPSIRFGLQPNTKTPLLDRDFPMKRARRDGWIEKLNRIGSPLGERLEKLDGYSFVNVKEVAILSEKMINYDIQVDSEEHTFIVEGFIVHNCMGKFHPHGDTAIYDALVRMSQDFSLNTPVIDGHGNFGSPNDSAAAMRYCVTGGTRVRLADGRSVRIADLVGGEENSDVPLDVNILDWRGRAVHASMGFNSGKHPVVQMKTRFGFELAGTTNHPVLCVVIDAEGKPSYDWKLLGQIRTGDIVCLASNDSESVPPTLAEHMVGMLLGGWVSEGWSSQERAGFNNCDKLFFDDVLLAYDTIVGGPRYVYERETVSGKTLYELDIQNTSHIINSPLASIMGLRAEDKSIPEVIWQGTKGLKRAFLMALFEGDGGISSPEAKSKTIFYGTYSQQLARDVQELLLEFGVVSNLRSSVRASGKTEYRLMIQNVHNILQFMNNIGFAAEKRFLALETLATLSKDGGNTASWIPELREYVIKHAPRGGRSWLRANAFTQPLRWKKDRALIVSKIKDEKLVSLMDEMLSANYHMEKVVSVEEVGEETVYSIRVDSEDHSFLAGGFVNHNTECRLSKVAMFMVDELNEDTVDFVPNYDGSLKEPVVLPAAYPFLLVNGSTGIAVGMATNMIPHNLGEVVNAARLLVRKPNASLDELMALIPGPDLPTGGSLIGLDQVRSAYESGKGTVRLRAKVVVEQLEGSRGRQALIITELPFNVGTEKVVEAVKAEIGKKRLQGISDIKDLSDRQHGTRLVIECKTGVNPQALLADLWKYTPLESSFGIANLALAGGQPRLLGLKEMLEIFLAHRYDVVTRRTQFRKKKAEDRKHIVEGILVALDNIDAVVKIIRGSKDTAEARAALIKKFKLSDIQAGHILDTPLRRLVSLEVETLRKELKELIETIAGLQKILDDDKVLKGIVDKELANVAALHAVPRRTVLVDGDLQEVLAASAPAVALEISDDPCKVVLSATGLIARTAAASEEAQEVGRKKSGRARHDLILSVVDTTARSQVLLVTSKGRAFKVDVLSLPPLPEAPGTVSLRGGVSGSELVSLTAGETVVAVVPMGEPAKGGVGLALGTRDGVVKICAPDWPVRGDEFDVIGLKGDDVIVGAGWVKDGSEELVFVSSDSSLLHFPSKSVRPQGRSGGGMAGIKLGADQKVVSFNVVDLKDTDHGEPMVVTYTGGSVKVTPFKEYPGKGRATGGVRSHKFLKGESELVKAWVGSRPVASTLKGEPVDLPDVNSRRDGSGSAVESEIGLFARFFQR